MGLDMDIGFLSIYGYDSEVRRIFYTVLPTISLSSNAK